MYNIFTEFNLLEYIEILVSGYNPNHSKVWGCLLEVIVVFLCTHNASVLKITNYVFTIHGFHVCIIYSYFGKIATSYVYFSKHALARIVHLTLNVKS